MFMMSKTFPISFDSSKGLICESLALLMTVLHLPTATSLTT